MVTKWRCWICFTPLSSSSLQVVPFHPATSSTSLQISLDQQEQVSMPFNFMQPGSLLIRTKGKVRDPSCNPQLYNRKCHVHAIALVVLYHSSKVYWISSLIRMFASPLHAGLCCVRECEGNRPCDTRIICPLFCGICPLSYCQ